WSFWIQNTIREDTGTARESRSRENLWVDTCDATTTEKSVYVLRVGVIADAKGKGRGTRSRGREHAGRPIVRRSQPPYRLPKNYRVTTKTQNLNHHNDAPISQSLTRCERVIQECPQTFPARMATLQRN